MVKSTHSKSREELSKMKVVELKALVKKHNLHNQIKGYTTMKKAGLVAALAKHSSKGEGDAVAPKKGKVPKQFEKKYGNIPSKKEKIPKVAITKKKRKLQPKKQQQKFGAEEEEPLPPRRRGRPPKRLVEGM